MVVSGFMALLMVVSIAGLIVDDRVLLGVPIWLKPFKFAVSFGIYSVTLAWMLSLPHKGQRWTWWLGTVFAVTGGFLDVSIVFLQAARGTFSHFNSAAGLDDTISAMFGIGVQGIILTNLGIAAVLGFQRLGDRAVSRAIHAGLFLALAGMAVGMLMVFVPEGQIDRGRHRPSDATAWRAQHRRARRRSGHAADQLEHDRWRPACATLPWPARIAGDAPGHHGNRAAGRPVPARCATSVSACGW